jgi:hypothetical protein
MDINMLEDNIDKVLKGMGCEGEKWICLAHTMVQKQNTSDEGSVHSGSTKGGEFLY